MYARSQLAGELDQVRYLVRRHSLAGLDPVDEFQQVRVTAWIESHARPPASGPQVGNWRRPDAGTGASASGATRSLAAVFDHGTVAARDGPGRRHRRGCAST
jgi:hypothetical protein